MIDPVGSLGVNPFSATLSAVKTDKAADAANDIGSFADIMGDMARNMVGNIQNAEVTSTNGILGKASIREVADAVMTADQTLQTAIAFRDKIVSAYLEVIKMPI